MYHHLLVPVDDTFLSAANTSQAVQLAKGLGARITFFHAAPDFSATDEGTLWRDLDPAYYAEQSLGDTRAILAKAAADAGAHGVPCSLHATVTDKPAQAIIDAADELACDLIVMATRGERGLRGWLHSSQTERVLRATRHPLLITRVESNEPLSDAEHALGLIHDEHRSMAVVIKGMQDLTQQALESDSALDVASMRRMQQYLSDFPEKLHHPKEEQFIHASLLQRHPEARHIIDELERQHQSEYAAISRLHQAIEDCGAGVPDALHGLSREINGYAEASWAHMGMEESRLLPLAQKYLQASDWAEIVQAFAGNGDPRFGDLSGAAFRRLFTSITHLLPAKA
jgi:nucleotide-binding universal stress UspA family protein/hemerythrin-like domain-containing protein